jgi:SAM-dependent methyltransferase
MEMVEMRRTHDSFYKNEKKGTVKQAFKQIGNLIESHGGSGLNIADIGCATGVMPNYLHSRFPQHSIKGLEFRQDLIDEARLRYPLVSFEKFDVQNRDSANLESFDIIVMSGVMQIFDDWKKVLSNLLSWKKKGGMIIIHGLFNDFNVDVLVYYLPSDSPVGMTPESGWNIVSKKSILAYFSGYKNLTTKFIDFDIDVELPHVDSDHVRSWTEKDAEGKLQIFNGLCIRQPQSFLVINEVLRRD